MKDIKLIMRRYVQYLKLEKTTSGHTVVAYHRDLDRFIEYCTNAGIDPIHPTVEDFNSFAAVLCDIGIHPTSLYRILMGVRSFYKYLIISGVIKDDPMDMLEMPKKPLHLPDVLCVEEVDIIEAAIDLSKPDGHRNKAIIETLFSCGLRVSELCNLRISNLFLREGYISVYGKGAKQRVIPMSPKAKHEILLYLRERVQMGMEHGFEDYLFVTRLRRRNISRSMVFRVIKTLVDQAGIDKIVSPHTFRHSFATCLLEGGASLRAIQKMLGHESISTTQMYTHIDTTHMREEVLIHHPRYVDSVNVYDDEEAIRELERYTQEYARLYARLPDDDEEDDDEEDE